ncbi:MAG TPA: glycosyltransferase family 2 protein [Chitinophagales bacterium]|nr:glycosyltransferase family 2 protein [Chitinophagales bacterium]
MSLLVLLPTLNEAGSVRIMLKEIKELNLPVVISDAGSTDETVAISKSENVPVIYRNGKGKGYGIQEGIIYAIENNFTHLLVTDADNTINASEIKKIEPYYNKYDLIIGKRVNNKLPTRSYLANKLLTYLVNSLFDEHFIDTCSGFHVFNLQKYSGALNAKNFDIDHEIICTALAKRYSYKVVELNYTPRKTDVSKANIFSLIPVIQRIALVRFFKR